jgi:hypothetical protein
MQSVEEDSEEKRITVDSMNLLCRESRHSIGLWAVILDIQPGAKHLQTLMTGRAIIRDSEDEYLRLA